MLYVQSYVQFLLKEFLWYTNIFFCIWFLHWMHTSYENTDLPFNSEDLDVSLASNSLGLYAWAEAPADPNDHSQEATANHDIHKNDPQSLLMHVLLGHQVDPGTHQHKSHRRQKKTK